MSVSLSVDELITEVRSQLDEENTANVTNAQILAALNRGQRKGTNIIARKFDSLFLTFDTSTTTTAGQIAYDLPSAAYGRRVEKVEVLEGSQVAWEIRRIGFHDVTKYESISQVTRPYYYVLTKNQIRIYPKPTGGLTLRIWYFDQPEPLVVAQGRITSITDSTTDSILVDSLGADISTDTTDGFNAYVNFIDYTTGDVKGSAQVAAIDTSTNQITFKSSGLTRSTVLGKTIATTIPTDLAVDDYVCVITGTCIPEIPGAYVDYLVQYAVVDIRRRLGESTDEEFAHLKDLEEEIEKMWVGREHSHRVRKSSYQWSRGLGSTLRRLLS